MRRELTLAPEVLAERVRARGGAVVLARECLCGRGRGDGDEGEECGEAHVGSEK